MSAFQILSASRRALFLPLLMTTFLLFAPELRAQFAPPDAGTSVRDTSALKPPTGSKVALVEFLDLQCPDCARANPLVKEAAATYKIPVLRHDFPLPFHTWSMDAAINARWFDTKSKTLGDEYRDQCFAGQTTIHTPEELQAFTEKFAKEHKLTLPAQVDPDGSLATLVKADYALGQKTGVEHTPTIWIVTAGSRGTPFVEVLDRGQLFQMIEQALADTGTTKSKKK
jgi:protein-disulfide isomerase